MKNFLFRLFLFSFVLGAAIGFAGCNSYISALKKLPDGKRDTFSLELGRITTTKVEGKALSKENGLIKAEELSFEHENPWTRAKYKSTGVEIQLPPEKSGGAATR